MSSELPLNFRLKRPCRYCPFSPKKTRIVFSCKARAEEIAEHAYRQGFPCHESAKLENIDEDEEGYVFGEKTQHCAGALMMFITDNSSEGWPGIGNDEELAEQLEKHLDWTAPHFESEQAFIDANTAKAKPKPKRRRTRVA